MPNNSDDVIRLLKIMQSVNKQNEARKSAVEENISPAVRSLKAAIPYMPLNQQKPLMIMAKIMEINDMLNKYRELVMQNEEYTPDIQQGILMAIKEQANEKQKNMIDTFIKITQISKILNMEMNKNE